MENIELYFFIGLSVVAVFSAIMMITRRNPVASAVYLILNFFTVSGIYLLLKAQFIAIIQILVYAGAIMVLFLFVIMLLNLKDESKLSEKITYKKLSAVLVSIFLFALIGFSVYMGFLNKTDVISADAEKIGKADFLGRELFVNNALPLELAGLMLLAAVVGAVILAKKKFSND